MSPSSENANIDLYAITTIDLSGVANVVLATSRDQAISHFMQITYLFAHAASDERFRVVGDDEDASLGGLHLIWETEDNAIEVASLTRPGFVEPQDGWISPKYAQKSFVTIAQALDTALHSAAGTLPPAEVARLRNSRASFALHRPLAGEILSGWAALNLPGQVSPAAAKQAWESMASVKQFVGLTALVGSKDGRTKTT